MSKYIWGFGLIIAGLLFLVDELYPSFDAGYIFANFWPLIFVVIGVNVITTNPNKPLNGILFILFGIGFTAANIVGFNIWEFWPVILIIIGISILFNNENASNSTGSSSSNDFENHNIAFWGSEISNNSKSFKGGNISAMFGGIELDLSDAVVSKDGGTLNVNVAFGGIEIKAPRNSKVEVKGTGILGAFENNIKNNEEKKGGTLIINGSAMFGAVEIN